MVFADGGELLDGLGEAPAWGRELSFADAFGEAAGLVVLAETWVRAWACLDFAGLVPVRLARASPVWAASVVAGSAAACRRYDAMLLASGLSRWCWPWLSTMTLANVTTGMVTLMILTALGVLVGARWRPVLLTFFVFRWFGGTVTTCLTPVLRPATQQ